MGLRERLATIGASGPIRVFPVTGAGSRADVSLLRLRPEIDLVDSPRHATVLLVAGVFTSDEIPGLAQVHDQLAPPRATVRWGSPLDDMATSAQRTGTPDDIVDTIRLVTARLYRDPSLSEPPVLPDVDHVEWRGVGPYGHGGKGMTGGTPYGRAMAERAPARDGLELDQLPLTVGPWASPLPPGMTMHLKLQGDVIQEAELLRSPVASDPPNIFTKALSTPQRVADLEMARASHHLLWLGEALRVHGLDALGLRAIGLADTLGPGSSRPVTRLLKMVRHSGIFSLALSGTGTLDHHGGLDGLGPVSRASGYEDDARSADPAYRELGFRTITHESGDSADRWRQRLAEIDQSLDLAGRARESTAFGSGVVETPRGRIETGGSQPSTVLVRRLGGWLAGLEWGDAVSMIWSLDIDPGAPAPVEMAAVETAAEP